MEGNAACPLEWMAQADTAKLLSPAQKKDCTNSSAVFWNNLNVCGRQTQLLSLLAGAFLLVGLFLVVVLFLAGAFFVALFLAGVFVVLAFFSGSTRTS